MYIQINYLYFSIILFIKRKIRSQCPDLVVYTGIFYWSDRRSW